MRELSLFSGGGGGLLGTHWLLGWRTVGYVEWEDYPQRVLAARIKDGLLPDAPIFGDVNAFIREGYADAYQGMVDVISAGFPCQPFSVAGQRRGDDDPRNQWPATIDTIRIVRPRYAFLENVPGLVTSGYFGTILGDLAESGYDARWRILSAAELGAPHKRDRLWIVAKSSSTEWRPQTRFGAVDIERSYAAQGGWQQGANRFADICEDVADASGAGLERHAGHDATHDESGRHAERQNGQTGGSGVFNGRDWWSTEPDVGRVAHRVASRVDRLKAIGNGQVPAVAARAWLELTGGLI